MKKELVYVIGLMSGTSLDGIDLVYVEFNKNNYLDFKILYAKTYGYSKFWKMKLQEGINLLKKEIKTLDIDYGVLLGKTINGFIDEFNIVEVNYVSSHGHTVFHQPEKGITLQVGNGQEIANITRQKVVCDFRSQDVKLGGQGAPLVPIGDQLLFPEYDYCLNLGGFANISFQKNNKRIAYDICAVNIVLNKYALQLGFEYDDKGEIAASGSFLMQVETHLRAIPFYKEKPPKSLGLEWVKKEVFPLLESSKRKSEDILRTFTDHIAWAIAKEIPKGAKVLITGGGAFNEYLISKINYNKSIHVILPNKKIIEFKEALIFAFLGLLRVGNQVNCLSSVTGASKDHSSGEIFYPHN